MASAGYCQRCKSLRHRGYKRLKEENLLLDEAGGAWWIWDPRGDVLVSGKPTKDAAIIALGGGEADVEDNDLNDLASHEHHSTKKKSTAQLDREIAEALASSKARGARHHHTTILKASTPGRWSHRAIAQRLDVPEDVVRRVYAAVQIAKRQGLYGGYMADLIERGVGRRLVGREYDVAARAKEHLSYDPPGGYGGPKPTGSAKEPPRTKHDDPKIARAAQLISSANAIIKDVLRRRKHPAFGWDESNDSKDRALLQQAADELDVAADSYEEAGAGIRAGTLHERARYARRGDYRLLAAYD